MENLILLIFILIVFFLQSLGQILERRKRASQKEKTSEETPLEEIFETIEIPYPAEMKVPVEVSSEKTEEIAEKAVEETQEIKEEKTEEAKPEQDEIISSDEWETAIIYSTILGTPKALQFRRGAGTGIQAGLKNR